MNKKIVWPEINLDRTIQAFTLRQQIENQLACAIRAGKLPYGSLLPSSRVMAKLLSVSRGTVVQAYDALLEAGMLIASPCSGIHVACLSPSAPNVRNLERTVAAAHYPARICLFEDSDGTPLYLNMGR